MDMKLGLTPYGKNIDRRHWRRECWEFLNLRINMRLEKLYSWKRPKFYAPRSIKIVNKSRRMRWARHVSRNVEMKYGYKLLGGKSEGKKPVGRLEVDGRIIPEWILDK
jgi:hypothetical protein